MTTLLYVSIPLISAFLGWVTNLIAIKMLFRPRKKVLCFHGLIPKRKNDIAKKISVTIEEKLLSSKDLLTKINKEKVYEIISESIDEIINENLSFIASLVPDEIISDFKNVIIKKVFNLLNTMNEEEFRKAISISDLIESKIINMDMTEIENMVLTVAKKELKSIEVMGAIIGFIVGLFQILLLILL